VGEAPRQVFLAPSNPSRRHNPGREQYARVLYYRGYYSSQP
jgi:hypothetical protein